TPGPPTRPEPQPWARAPMCLKVSTSQGIADGRTDLAHGVCAHLPDAGGQRRLRDGVDAVAIDHRWLLESDFEMIETDLGGQPTGGSGDFGDSDQGAYVEHLGPGQHHDRPPLATHVRQPELAPRHASFQVSTSAQNVSGP